METAMPKTKGHFSCNDCGSEGSQRWMLNHDCSHNQYVNESGGRCEDYPCCGHTDGDGCRTLESHTSDYWLEILAARDADDDYRDWD